MRWCISVWVVLASAAACSDSGNGSPSAIGGDDASTSDDATADASVGDSSSGDGAGDASSQDGSSACGDPESMMPAWTATAPQKDIYVSPAGNDANDGSQGKPLLTPAAAAKLFAPGVRVNFTAGMYAGDFYVPSFAGTAAMPGVIRSSDGPRKAHLVGAVYLEKSTYVLVDGIELSGSTGHGMQIDSGGTFDPNALSGNIVLHGAFVHDTALASIKVAQSHFIYVIGNELSKSGPGRQNVEFVAVDDTVVAGNYGHDSDAFNEVKGGAHRAVIARNRVEDTGGILIGGDCTGMQFLVDPSVQFEAQNVTAWGNVITGGAQTVFRVVGCHDCLVANNSFYNTQSASVLRLIHDAFASGEGGGNCDVNLQNQNVRIVNNVFFSQATPVDVIASNDSASNFTLSHNVWFSSGGDITKAYSDLPFIGEPTSIYADPQLTSPPTDLSPKTGSPVIGKGLALPEVPGNARGACWSGAPDIGAY